jgi:hypothetical protein
MPQRRWSRELILDRIRELRHQGSDLTPSQVGAQHGALVSAAERYFGNWSAAVRAAGVDYEQVRASGRRRRSERIRVWSRDRIVAEIRRLHGAGEDLSWAMMERKHQPLCAAAVKRCYFGSWAAALAAAGVDYEQVKTEGRAARRWKASWRKELGGAPTAAESADEGQTPGPPATRRQAAPTARSGWAQDLLREQQQERARDNGA